MPRVISLLASATEIGCALGFEDALVGRSHECDWLVSMTRLPQVSRPASSVNRGSHGIDVAVKERLRGPRMSPGSGRLSLPRAPR